MRESRRLVDTDAQPWEVLSDVLQRKVLNGDPDTGPHTLLLQSGPRGPGPDFAQYHPIDEELFAIDGDFTFDGSTWFGNGSYAFYPAYFVHGTHVHVRGGYLVYLRLSGPSELFKVDEPTADAPYFVGDGQTDRHAMQLADAWAEQDPVDLDDDAAIQVTPLHRDASTGRGSSLVKTSLAATGRPLELISEHLLEVFTLAGTYSLADQGTLTTHGYHCEVGEHPALSLRCDEPGTLLISHDGDLHLRTQGVSHTI